MQYAFWMSTDPKPQIIRYTKTIKLPDRKLTLEDITKHLKCNETFSFYVPEEGDFVSRTYMHIQGSREETEKEIKERVKKAEKYNKNYEKFHQKYPK